MVRHELYMSRCIELAKLAKGQVKTNPNVGALLLYENRIIGEGYHAFFGGPHAEVEAIQSVKPIDFQYIKDSTLYVTLEPCNIQGKTPPCSLLILENKIKKMVIGCKDPNPKMSGSSLQFLRERGVQIIENVLEKECLKLILPFTINILLQRPFITIKFAQSKDLFLAKKGEQTWLSNDYSKILSHKLRNDSNGILIGTKTAEIDNPQLTNRLFGKNSPLRIVLDRNNKLSNQINLLSDPFKTILINEKIRKDLNSKIKEQWVIPYNGDLLNVLLERLYSEKNIGRLIVEGGARTITHFIKMRLWDEALIITVNKKLGDGIRAPIVEGGLEDQYNLGEDKVVLISRQD